MLLFSKMNFSLKNGLRCLLAIILFGLCILPAFIKAGIGAVYFDEPFQNLRGLSYIKTPLAPLTAVFGGLYWSLVDWSWLDFRYLAIFNNPI